MTRHHKHVNQGIQATQVTAGALAVGQGAHATQNVYSPRAEELDDVLVEVAKLRTTIAAEVEQTERLAILEEDLDRLRRNLEERQTEDVAETLSDFTKKLRLVGAAVSEGTAIGAALVKIATLLRLPLSLIGLG